MVIPMTTHTQPTHRATHIHSISRTLGLNTFSMSLECKRDCFSSETKRWYLQADHYQLLILKMLFIVCLPLSVLSFRENRFLWHLQLLFPQSSSEFTERRWVVCVCVRAPACLPAYLSGSISARTVFRNPVNTSWCQSPGVGTCNRKHPDPWIVTLVLPEDWLSTHVF